LRERLFHHFAILEDVRDAGWAPQVILENVELAIAVAHEVGAGHVAPDASGRVEADALFSKRPCRADEVARHDAVLQDFLLVINVVDEKVESVDPLLQPTLDTLPLMRLDDARHDVERKDPLRSGAIAVDVERDPHVEQCALCCLLPAKEFAIR
jgi:hypothetical protein